MNIKRSLKRQSQKRGGSPRVLPSPELPLIETPYWEVMLRSLLPKVTPQDLALVAAGLSRGRPIDKKTATALINDACMLLGMAASKLLPPQPSGMAAPPVATPSEISGATFLTRFLPGSGPVYLERRREFGRSVMQLLEGNGAPGTSQRIQTPADVDDWLSYFKTLKLSHEFVSLFQRIATEVKDSPKAKRKRVEASRKGGLTRTAQQLAKCLTDMGESAQICDLINNRRYKEHVLESTISENPTRFERFTDRGLPAVRLVKNSKKILKHP